jgi:DNA invertase Pin-like site-specific DNA recombinase
MKAKIRCAIYTRKSSEEGLEQAFNSLDAQREACEAYIRSQRHEGWLLAPGHYDDGGFSGGSMERPALQQLLRDIAALKIDVVVVYKVDRLTRALTDFARIIDIFDRHGVSFVSVTQQFSTTTSMGRLTLNMLLSFAQFEREVTGERIRDKIAASKRKGMWMGGLVPLGYERQERTLVINEAEAETVRAIFRIYLELGCVRRLKDEVDRQGLRSKPRSKGRSLGGLPFTRGHLYRILSNPLYIGEIAHKGETYPGQHPGIIARETWEAVQAMLAANRQGHRMRGNAAEAILLHPCDLRPGHSSIRIRTFPSTSLVVTWSSKAALRPSFRNAGTAFVTERVNSTSPSWPLFASISAKRVALNHAAAKGGSISIWMRRPSSERPCTFAVTGFPSTVIETMPSHFSNIALHLKLSCARTAPSFDRTSTVRV